MSRYYTNQNYTYGGWISNDKLSVNHINLMTDWLLNNKSMTYLSWRFNSYDPILSAIKYQDHHDKISNKINSINNLKEFNQINTNVTACLAIKGYNFSL